MHQVLRKIPRRWHKKGDIIVDCRNKNRISIELKNFIENRGKDVMSTLNRTQSEELLLRYVILNNDLSKLPSLVPGDFATLFNENSYHKFSRLPDLPKIIATLVKINEVEQNHVTQIKMNEIEKNSDDSENQQDMYSEFLKSDFESEKIREFDINKMRREQKKSNSGKNNYEQELMKRFDDEEMDSNNLVELKKYMYQTDLRLNMLEYFFDQDEKEDMNFGVSMLVRGYMKEHLRDIKDGVQRFKDESLTNYYKKKTYKGKDLMILFLIREVLKKDAGIDAGELSEFLGKLSINYAHHDQNVSMRLPVRALGIDSIHYFIFILHPTRVIKKIINYGLIFFKYYKYK